MGSFHTIDIDLQHPVTIWKQEWNFVSLNILQELSNAIDRAEIAAVIFQPGMLLLYTIPYNHNIRGCSYLFCYRIHNHNQTENRSIITKKAF